MSYNPSTHVYSVIQVSQFDIFVSVQRIPCCSYHVWTLGVLKYNPSGDCIPWSNRPSLPKVMSWRLWTLIVVKKHSLIAKRFSSCAPLYRNVVTSQVWEAASSYLIDSDLSTTLHQISVQTYDSRARKLRCGQEIRRRGCQQICCNHSCTLQNEFLQ